ncbi:dynein light chain Tctex-type 1-like [Stegodyphus dumicola]|uniref:dynein light chain Tctex-type 1-like n=1 Tax=Stegodyphus dumicola TaxID=202533 RepID=UPI0015AB141E|nr:dynein light chain Tctex-type 1-like [Stegodyphus dumicola]
MSKPVSDEEKYKTHTRIVIRDILWGQKYDYNKLSDWTTQVIQKVLYFLESQAAPNKYIVTCVILQKTGSGYNCSSSCHFDDTTDVSCYIRWENDSMVCIVNIYVMNILYGSPSVSIT